MHGKGDAGEWNASGYQDAKSSDGVIGMFRRIRSSCHVQNQSRTSLPSGRFPRRSEASPLTAETKVKTTAIVWVKYMVMDAFVDV